MTRRIDLKFEGPGPDSGHGVDIDDVITAARHFRNAVRHVVADMVGIDISRGRPNEEVRAQSEMRLVGDSKGSLIAHLEIGPAANGSIPIEDRSAAAVGVVLDSQSGSENTLPLAARKELEELAADLPTDVSMVTIGDQVSSKRIQLQRWQTLIDPKGHLGTEEALLFGWLREVNWARGTAQVHGWGGNHVNLRFDADLAEDMRRLATEFVQITGSGNFGSSDSWGTVTVNEIVAADSSNRKPFDLDAFLNAPNPKIFDPGTMGNIDLTNEEFESFINSIHEGRDK